jgi:hypothetical protein
MIFTVESVRPFIGSGVSALAKTEPGMDKWLVGQPTRGQSGRDVHATNLLELVSPPCGSRKCSYQEISGTAQLRAMMSFSAL